MSTSCSGNGMAFFAANFMLQQPHNNDAAHDHHHPPSCSTSTCLSSLLPSCSAAHHQDFHGAGMGMAGLGKRSMSSFPTGTGLDMCDDEHEEHQNPAANGGGGDEDLSDDGSLQLVGGEKKRRLNMEQVRTLEKNFELGNKLEPERKMQLAKALGLQPRQIAIWFQNRRARWKTKQLEKDYDTLKKRFDALKSDNDALHSENQKLQAEIVALKNNKEPTESINLNKENTEGSSSNRSENSSQEIKLEISRTPAAAAAAVAAPYLDDQYRSRHSPLSAAPASALHHHQPTSSMPLFPPSSSSPTGLANINRHINAGGPHHPHRLYMTMATHEEQRTFQGATTVRPDVDQADRFDNHHHHHHHHQSAAAAVHVKEENATITNNNSFSNMFVSMVDDQSGFWPWLEQNNFN